MALNEIFSIIIAILTAVTAGLIGAFALMKRMTLAADAISHVALPGIGIAIIFTVNPIIGAAAALLIGAILIWKLEQKTGLSTETTIGVVFTSALALGAMLTTSEELIDALFGRFQGISWPIFIIGLICATLIIWFVIKYKDELVLNLFSKDLAKATGVDTNKLDLFFILAFALTIILGLKFLGALLAGSLAIIPAAVARQLTGNLKSFLLISAIVSLVSMISGILISSRYGTELGPTVIIVAAALFFLSLLRKGV
ncbi:MAG: metal ABC transporter permease [Candidatus Paceibacterota bacterium]|jgi:ABC-type Mn2+/Zn2+ transport system permease subunit